MATTVEQFLKRNAEFNANKTTHWTNGEIDVICNKLPISQLVKIQDEFNSDFEAAKEIIYLSCPIFRDLANTGNFDVHEPHNVLEEVLTLDEIRLLFTHCVEQVSGGSNEIKKP